MFGFTLVELMVTIAVFAILLAIALPNFSDLILGQRTRTATSDVYGALLYARSEAIKRNATINVVRTGSSWESGWSVETSGGTVLKRQDPFTGITISSDSSSPLIFGGNGRPTAGALGATFMVYPTAKPTWPARCVNISLSGLPSVKVDTDSDKTNGC